MKITIITVCFNAEKVIEKTIQSVIEQTYPNIEYIIIDGASNDKTLDIINKYKKKWNIKLVSEKDNGIYDAMNKGIDLATGEYINFMNAGDYFYKKQAISISIPYFDNYDIIYGNTEIRYKNFSIIKKEVKPAYLWTGPVNHQSSFIKTSKIENIKYNTSNKLLADYEFFLIIYYSTKNIKKIPITIASFAKDGVTEIESMRVIKDAHKTIQKFKKNVLINVYYYLLRIKPFIKKVSSEKFFKFLKTGKLF